jgi:hypothetical protein
VSPRSATRTQLEESLRALVPARRTGEGAGEPPEATTAAAGVGGLVVGYAWGWWRGRRGARAGAGLTRHARRAARAKA